MLAPLAADLVEERIEVRGAFLATRPKFHSFMENRRARVMHACGRVRLGALVTGGAARIFARCSHNDFVRIAGLPGRLVWSGGFVGQKRRSDLGNHPDLHVNQK